MPRNDIDYGSRPISFRACKTRLREVTSRLRPRSKSLLGRKDIRNKEQKTMNKGGKKSSRHVRQTRCPSRATSAPRPMTCLRCKDNRAVTGRRVFRDIGRVECGCHRSSPVMQSSLQYSSCNAQSFLLGAQDTRSIYPFAFLTGVTKFGKVSVFSNLNNLKDISMMERYIDIRGISEYIIQ